MAQPNGFKLVASVKADDKIPVSKFVSNRTGLTVCIAQVEGPLVNGYFCLATEAHDDDGLPHTLEHLVFMGSEDYPYKGVLDNLANRCLASGTNAWTDTDHTCYTMTNAGSEGFLNLLPIYLDHILYPTLTEEAYITEVHHINGAGENAGVVYCEMQGRENSGESRTHLELSRAMYPGRCGYKSETGGIMENLRTSTSHDKVCAYHREYYRPENLCLVITGQISPEFVFRALEPLEKKILSKGDLPEFKRPWQSSVPPLLESVVKPLKYAADEEEHGMLVIGWRGPLAKDQYTFRSLMVLFEYLSDSPVSPLQRDFVEIPEPFCSTVHCSMMENSEGCIYFRFSNVPTEKLNQISHKLAGVIQNLANETEKIDMNRMESVLHRRVLDSLSSLEDNPHDTIALAIIGDFLYGDTKEDLISRVENVKAYKQMKTEAITYWVNLIRNFFIDKPSVEIIGEPSQEEMKTLATQEEERVAKQQQELGESGLKEKADVLQHATESNDIKPPSSVLTCVDVPSVSSIFFHPINPSSNVDSAAANSNAKFPLAKIPISFRFDEIHTNFVQLNALLDSSPVPQELKFYLPVFCEVLFESPILKAGVLIPHEEVIAQLEADTLKTEASIGIHGSKFSCGSQPQVIHILLKVEEEKYSKGVQWLHELLYKTRFTADRLKIVANKLTNDISSYKRKGQVITRTLLRSLIFAEDCNHQVSSLLRQQTFLKQLMQQLEKQPQQVEEKMEALRQILTDPANMVIHMSADVAHLSQPQAVWDTFIPADLKAGSGSAFVKKTSEFVRPVVEAEERCLIAGIGSVESSFLVQVIPSIRSYQDPDLAPVMVFIQYLTQLEGPMWREIRGLGLSYHYSVYVNPETGLLYFILAKSTHIVNAYKKGKNIIMGYVNGDTKFDQTELDSAKSSLTFEVIEKETSVSDVSQQSMLSYFKGVPHTYNKDMLEKIEAVTLDDLQRVGKQYIAPVFNMTMIRCAVCCNPSKVEEIVEGFKGLNMPMKVIPSLSEGPFCSV